MENCLSLVTLKSMDWISQILLIDFIKFRIFYLWRVLLMLELLIMKKIYFGYAKETEYIFINYKIVIVQSHLNIRI